MFFAGTIRKVENVGFLLKTAELIKSPKEHFLIFGYKDELKNLEKE